MLTIYDTLFCVLFSSRGSMLCCLNFSHNVYLVYLEVSIRSFIANCAAASLATGTLKGEQDT
jgi:hypothetical protein